MPHQAAVFVQRQFRPRVRRLIGRSAPAHFLEEVLMSRAAARSTDLEPIDRLEEKVKALVSMIGRLKADAARAADENSRLSRELESARARIADSEAELAEVSALRMERETIRGRVSDMLEQLEGLSL